MYSNTSYKLMIKLGGADVIVGSVDATDLWKTKFTRPRTQLLKSTPANVRRGVGEGKTLKNVEGIIAGAGHFALSFR